MCYGDWLKAQGNLRCAVVRYEPEWVETIAATSAEQCCTLAKSRSSALNPIEAWQFEASRADLVATTTAPTPTCVFLKRKFFQSKGLDVVRPAGMFVMV